MLTKISLEKMDFSFKSSLATLSFLCASCFASSAFSSSNVAFYYGAHPPLDELRWFYSVVFEPSNGLDPKLYNTSHSQALAYLSLGEVDNKEQFNGAIPASWIVGRNRVWQSSIVDEGNPDWQKFIVNNVVAKLWDAGYRGFFLDTLDSYQLIAKTPAAQNRQMNGLITIIEAIKKKYPTAQLILNRGFELLPQVHSIVNAVAAESLYGGWDQQRKKYIPVSEADRADLLDKLNRTKALGIPVIAIEYLPATKTEEAKNIAAKISQLGFAPWITNGDLTNLDFMKPPQISRKILVIYDTNISNYIFNSDALAYLAMPLQYLGYVPEFQDIDKPLPTVATGEYAGIAVWLTMEHPNRQENFYTWVLQQKQHHIPIVFFNQFGFENDKSKLAAIGLDLNTDVHSSHSVRIKYQAPSVGFEVPPSLQPEQFLPVHLRVGNSLLEIEDEVGNTGDMVAVTPWGGYALYPYSVMDVTKEDSRWVINPFTFLKQTLRLPDMPVPDTTTENGNRIMLVHVDGDGIANKGEWYHGPYAGKVLQTEIFEHYHVPTTVSIIQGETAANGLYPKDSKALEEISREIFRLPWVEIASHTFSHPYNWQPAAIDPNEPPNNKFEAFNLNIPNYHFNLQTEILGSVNYINSVLAPANKKCHLLLWSGDANPPVEALAIAEQHKIKNYNGGDSDISNYRNSITHVGPVGVSQNAYYQTFAQIQNDYIYTNEWTPPFYGFITVIDAFKLTEQPLRLKPIDVYFHMYAGSKIASLTALKRVLDYALSQPVINFYISEYIDKIADFNSMVVAEKNHGWLLRSNGDLRELRVPTSKGYPDLQNSQNVIGYNKKGNDYYIHLGPDTESFIQFANNETTQPYIATANAQVTKFVKSQAGISFTLTGHVPIKLSLANMNHCGLEADNKKLTPVAQFAGLNHYELSGVTQDAFSIKCQ